MQTARITASHRLQLTLFLAACLHAILILGLGFDITPREQRVDTHILDIILTAEQSQDEPPREADFLSATNQHGGSAAPQPAPSIARSEAVARPAPSQVATPPASPETPPGKPEPMASAAPEPSEKPAPKAEMEASADSPSPEPAPAEDMPDTSRLLARSLEIARLTAEIRSFGQSEDRFSREGRSDSPSSRSAVEAQYIHDWTSKVQRIGNLNYPDEARRQNLSGRLTLDVLMDSSGKVLEINLVRSSGHAALDDAARRIVRMSSPFPPFPPAMREKYDRYHIRRTWEFASNATQLH